LLLSLPEDTGRSKFGQMISVGYPDYNEPKAIQVDGQFSMLMFIPDPSVSIGDFLKASEFMLKYKGRLVSRLQNK